MLQACDSGWRCDIKCCALAHTRKCAFFPLVSIPCFCDQRERNLTGDVLPSASRQCSVRLQQSAHVFAFSLLSSSTVPVCWSCADSSTHLRWLKTSSWWKKTRCSITVGLLGLSEKLRTILSQLKKNKGRGYKDESLAVDVVYVVLPRVHTVGVLLQPDLLGIGLCSGGLWHRTWRSFQGYERIG